MIELTLLVGVGLNVPVSESITGVVALIAGHFDLLETPLWKINIGSSEITAHNWIPKPESSSQSSYTALIAGRHVLDDFDLPVVLIITNGKITVAGHFLLALGNRGRDIMSVEVSSSLSVNQADDITISNESRLFLRVIVAVATVRVEPPFVVGIFVVVASNLLLSRPLGERL